MKSTVHRLALSGTLLGATAVIPSVARAQQVTVQQLRIQMMSMEARTRELERRVKELEEQAALSDEQEREKGKPEGKRDSSPLTVRAPFNVVDQAGRPILQVTAPNKNGDVVFVHSNNGLATLSGTEGGFHKGNAYAGIGVGDNSGAGFLYLKDKSGADLAQLGIAAATNRLALRLWANNHVMVDLGSSDDDFDSGALKLGNGQGKFTAQLGNSADSRMGLTIYDNSGQMIAGIGASRDAQGGGGVKVYNTKGLTGAALLAKPANTSFSIYDNKGTPVANIASDAAGRGFISVGTATNPEAGSLAVSEDTGHGMLTVRDRAGTFARVGVKGGPVHFGDVCVNSAKQKGVCLSVVAVKTILPYY